MKRARLLAAMLAVSPLSVLAALPSPRAPAEVAATAPEGTTLLAFATSGDQPHADAAAVFETRPDKEGVRHRTLVLFGKNDGRFVEDFSSDRLIACSMCSQFHDDPFDADYLKVTPGRVRIVQMDGGEKPSTTTLDLARQAGVWHVKAASRRTVEMGRYDERVERLLLPTSGLAKDMDAQWHVPVYLNTLLVNRKNGKFMFLHGHPTVDAMWESQKGDCTRQDCTVLAQQQDGCISLVRDESARSFGGESPDPKGEQQAASRAMAACNAAGGKACKEIRTDCTRGIL
ncbi:DUF4189 domain-containing protein [Frateuria defendens]|uniref:DUF4189 domain-containing protein n=1 Tax=Frateuria defendens TaxID=2219559 RepID=UPI00066FFA07|nr:DUF4189 domain-containing protein [Frateuria defendens]